MATEFRRVQVTRRNLPPSGRQFLRRWSDRTRWKLGDREWFAVVEQALDAGNADLAHRVALNGVRVAIAETAAGATRHTAVTHVDAAAASRVPSPFDAASDGHAVAVTASGGETSAGVEGVSPKHADLRQAAVADVVEPCAAPSVGTASGPAAPAASPSSPDVTSPARNEPLAAAARSHSRLEPAAPGTWADSFLVFVTRVLLTIGIVVVCAVFVAMLSAVTENALGRTSAGRLALAAAAAFFVAAVLAVRKPGPPRVSPHRYEHG